MPSLDAWIGTAAPLGLWRDDHDRAQDSARVIAENPTSLVVKRFGVDQPAQTVRLDPVGTGAAQKVGYVSEMPAPMLQITGYKGHPTLTATDIQIQDEFVYDGLPYAVKHIVVGLMDRFVALAEQG